MQSSTKSSPNLTSSPPEPEIKVTRIKNRWHARMFVNGEVRDEMACENRIDIGYICKTMLRWFDKCGGMSKFASAARQRLDRGPYGRVWYQGHLRLSKEKHNKT